MKAVVIFSGGQDSTTCLKWALNRFDEVEAITFNYGQKHLIELNQAKLISKALKVNQIVIDISFLNTIIESALTSKNNLKKSSSLVVPNRNQLFITMAHSYAQKIGAENLVTGVCQTDFSGYPDCRESFIKAIEWTTNMGSNTGIKIHTPLMYLTKGEIFKLAQDEHCLQMVIDLSHTCYNGDREHKYEWGFGCNDCPACKLRKEGFNEYKKTNV